jgi:hypothetical protein
VRTAVVRGATASRAVRGDAAALLAPFIDAARALTRDGAVAIATSCGFLAPFQRELAAAVPVPVARVVAAAARLARAAAAGRPTCGRDHHRRRCARRPPPRRGRRAARHADRRTAARRRARVVRVRRPAHARPDTGRRRGRGGGRRLAAAEPALGAIVLECTNLPPYRDALVRALGLPVYDINTLLRWLWAGAARPMLQEPSR